MLGTDLSETRTVISFTQALITVYILILISTVFIKKEIRKNLRRFFQALKKFVYKALSLLMLSTVSQYHFCWHT